MGNPEVAALFGNVGGAEFGLLVTLGTFTSKATNFARSKSILRLIDGAKLVKLVFEHYDQFDSRYKGLLPLRRVYVPEAIDTEGS
jgi:restriction system protein